MKAMWKKTVALLIVAAVAVPLSGSAISTYKNAKDEVTTTAEQTAESSVTVTSAESTTAVTEAIAAATAKAKNETRKTTVKAAVSDDDYGISNEKATKVSKLIDGAKASKSWSVSANSMSVYAEKVQLKLNEYEGSIKTSKTVNRFAYVAVIQGKASGFKSVSATQSTGKTVDTVLNAAKAVNAAFAINGEMCNHNVTTYDGFLNAATDMPTATVIKNGKVAQSKESTPSLTMTSDGIWSYPVWVAPSNAQSLIDSGVITSIGYTYPVLWQGKPYYIEDGSILAPMWNEHGLLKSNVKNSYYNDHVLVGQIDQNTFVVAVSESFGRGYLCEMMQNMGVQNAYWANGGHCATMYIKGYGVVNRPNDKSLCGAADILYF